MSDATATFVARLARLRPEVRSLDPDAVACVAALMVREFRAAMEAEAVPGDLVARVCNRVVKP